MSVVELIIVLLIMFAVNQVDNCRGRQQHRLLKNTAAQSRSKHTAKY